MSDVTEAAPRILQRPEHSISRKNVSHNTLKVLYRLDRAGFKGFLVGGGVRDLLLGRQPKDFDISTDARPEQVRRLFRNSRIIGRRFRLVHVFFQGEVVEVSTFRREPDPEEQKSAEDELLITSDNTYGTPRQDAFRRDFTINALFYNIADFSVIDFTGGIDDLQAGVVRTIGDPLVRFQEDPVRMLRACEFAGRLGFVVERRSQEAIRELHAEVEKAAPARLTEEIVQLMKSGHAAAAMDWMLDLGLTDVLLPEIEAMVESRRRGPADLSGILAATDRLVRSGREVSDAVLLGLLLLPEVLVRREETETSKGRTMRRGELEVLVEEVTRAFVSRFVLSRLRTQQMRHGMTGFLRLCDPRWGKGERARFVRRPFFDDALQLYEVLADATGEGGEPVGAWKKLAAQRPPGRETAQGSRPRRKGPRRRRRRPRRRRS